MLTTTTEELASKDTISEIANEMRHLHTDMDQFQAILQLYEDSVAVDFVENIASPRSKEDALELFWHAAEGKALRHLIVTHLYQTRRLEALVKRAEAQPRPPQREGDHFEAVKGEVLKCMEVWKAYLATPPEVDEAAEMDKMELCDSGIERFNPSSPEVALAKLIIAKGDCINSDLKNKAERYPADRREYQAVRGALEWFGLTKPNFRNIFGVRA
jgi:hypothetical protein